MMGTIGTQNRHEIPETRVPSRKPSDYGLTVSLDFTTPIPYQSQNLGAFASIHCGCDVESQEVLFEQMGFLADSIAKFETRDV